MALLEKIKAFVVGKRPSPPDTPPAEGYNLWAPAYDAQPDNLMLALDEAMVAYLLQPFNLGGKVLVDVGCGTGRHWLKIMTQQPAQLVGYDVSEGMLAILQQKFPDATTYLLDDTGLLTHTPDGSCDMVISTLTMAHIPDAAAALQEWHRVLKPGGYLLITDYHPTALARGANRSFTHQNKTVHIKNHVHHLDRLQQLCKQLDMQVQRVEEKVINETMKPWYEKQAALAIFERYRGTPIIYGLLAQK